MPTDSDAPNARPDDDVTGEPTPSVARLARTALDAAVWGGALFLGGAVVLAAGGFALGVGPVGVKRALFLLGFLTLGGSLLALRPRRAWGRERGGRGDGSAGRETTGADGGDESGAEAPWGFRAFAAGIWALAASYLLETAFGVVPG